MKSVWALPALYWAIRRACSSPSCYNIAVPVALGFVSDGSSDETVAISAPPCVKWIPIMGRQKRASLQPRKEWFPFVFAMPGSYAWLTE